MKKLLLLFLVIFSCNSIAISQTSENANLSKFTFHSDGGSLGLLHSFTINVEGHVLTSKTGKVNLYIRGGYNRVIIDFFGTDRYNGGLAALAILVGENEHRFESNVGIFTLIHSSGDSDDFNGIIPLPMLSIGYRYQKPEGGIIFRAKLGTLGLGIGLGYAF